LALAARAATYSRSLHDALPISHPAGGIRIRVKPAFVVLDEVAGLPLSVCEQAVHLSQVRADERKADPVPALQQGDVPVQDEAARSEEHTSELQLRENLVCRLLL